MAKYRPKFDIVIAEPCSESWDEMHGNSRVRHCAECDRDVHNLAALTPTQINALADTAGTLPCMRIARFADGTLLVADERRQQPAYSSLAGAAMAALVTISGSVARAQNTMGRIAPPTATYSGQLVDPFGKPMPKAQVLLSRTVGGRAEQTKAETDANGEFKLSAGAGDWELGATSRSGGSGIYAVPLHLAPGSQKADKPFTLQPIQVTAGVPAIAPPNPPAKPPKR